MIIILKLLTTNTDNNTIVTMLSDEYLKKDIIYEIKAAILVQEIKIRFYNDCLDNEQIDAMLSIVTGLNY